ncbi:subtilisin [Fictibacillus halophilus]|uniref:Subtilisin n=1 Tax=Fictibacillus halophilus TaxID=1610490 RepID=A0ABV2LHC0_9BACL|nr:S8 family serine peptidase [Fictibacillus halophilus]
MLNIKWKIGAVFISASLIAPIVSLPWQTHAATHTDKETAASVTQSAKHAYIVVFQNGIDEELLQSYGAPIKGKLESISAVSTILTEEAAYKLSQFPSVRFVEQDKTVQTEEQYINPYLAKLNFPPITDQNTSYYSGKGVKVGVLDTGIDTKHEDLKIAGGASFIPGASTYNDDNGHGTHVAGIIAAQDNDFGIKGLSPQVELYAIKVLDKNGVGLHSQIINGIEWAVQNKLNIINLSLSSEEGSKALRLAVDEAHKKGLHIVAASGNHTDTTFSEDQAVMFPAKYESVVAVGAIDQYDKHPNFSGSGPELEIVAPGVNIYSTFIQNNYEFQTGTSMATPYVTAIYSLYKEAYPNLTAQELRTKINTQAKDLGAPGRDVNYGYGLIQAPKRIQQPKAPKNLTYKILSNGKVQLNWSAIATNEEIRGYNIYRDGVKISSTVSQPSFSESIKPGFYKYEVTAVNDGGLESSKSAIETKVYGVFPDFKSSDWYSKYVYELNANHILSGYPDGKFYPLKPITRGEAVSMIGRALKLDGTPRATRYPDVKSSYFASGYVATMSEKGLATGFSDGTFKPMQTISRGEVIALLDRAYKLKETTGSAKSFKDIKSDFYAYNAVQRFSAASIANGYNDGTFKPNHPVTRSEMAVFLARTIEESN